MAEVSTTAVVIMIVVLIVALLLYKKGKKQYRAYVNALDKKDFALKDFMYMGFAIMGLIRYKYNTTLDRKNRTFLKELYDVEYAEFYLRVYWAQGATYTVIAFFLGAMVYLATNDALVGGLIAFGLGALMLYASLTTIEKKANAQHDSISMDLPELVNKIVILTGAGLNLQAALLKISREMSSDRVLYKELARTMDMIDRGETADMAFDRLGTKCNTAEMRRFLAIIIQNIHRAGGDVSNALKAIGDELWALRKATALRVAEAASTKMMFPMMLMLLAVILLVIAPAIQSMQL